MKKAKSYYFCITLNFAHLMDQKSVFSREFVKAFCQLEEQMKDGKQALHEEGTIPYTKDCST